MLRGLNFTHIVVLICDPRSVEIDGSVHHSLCGVEDKTERRHVSGDKVTGAALSDWNLSDKMFYERCDAVRNQSTAITGRSRHR